MRSLCLTATAIILIAVGTGLAQEPAGRKLYPVDESHLDPSFAEFKARLLEAVERQDFDFLLSIAHPNIVLSIEGGSRESLKRNWKAKNYGGAAWQDLRDVLLLGAVRRNDSRFCAPYVSTNFPDELRLFYVVITGSDVPIREEPNSTAPIIDHLSYDIVQTVERGQRSVWETIEGERYRWRRIETPSGEIGYVWAKYARDPRNSQVCFEKVDGEWMMTRWQAQPL